ncbi:DUF2809 domain-containing protein [Streptomyces roseicoloratus]|uniref:DUF2809 domain-containing protein n=1 Tax=Streptomyces roseicoloratus TaxID=2508722 RepID=A0ABY9RSI8_9ACTN|nr:DUF2809 domain-containing protein [Streptomyces roseicoloratus]WMX45141.1 DUF2809 domain-containing protein [Streptomyces roseicoloratus]
MTERPEEVGPVRARLWTAGAGLAVVAAGLGIRSVGRGPVAEHAGDALYTVLVLTLVVLVAPRIRPGIAASAALGFSCAVELFQLSGIPAQLATHAPLARLVLGTSFNAPDLLWYAVGAAFGWTVHRAVRTRRGPGQSLGTTG